MEWIARCLDYMRRRGAATIEATDGAEREWVAHVSDAAKGWVLSWGGCNSWYLGANIPGKPRVCGPYVGGLDNYARKCDDVADGGYTGFHLRRADGGAVVPTLGERACYPALYVLRRAAAARALLRNLHLLGIGVTDAPVMPGPRARHVLLVLAAACALFIIRRLRRG